MKLLVGLGNPGSKYRATKHNIGFISLDEIAYRKQLTFNQNQFTADYTTCFENGEKILLVKPQTFMNESGQSVGAFLRYYNLEPKDLLVVYDDLDLPVGTIRLREKGSAGGHNGMKSIIQHLGTQEFPRIRVGISRPRSGETVVQHVLSPFPKTVHQDMLYSVKKAADAALYWLTGHDFSDTMNQYNRK